MSNTENNENQSNESLNATEACEATDSNLGGEVSVDDLRAALNIDDISDKNNDGTVDASSHAQIEPNKDAAGTAKEPDQGKLSSVADDSNANNAAQDVAGIEPASGDADMSLAAAQKLAQMEPAAGDAAPTPAGAGGGYGFQSSFAAQGVIPLNDVGPIDPTELKYGVSNKNEDLFAIEKTVNNSLLNPIMEISDQFVYEDGSVIISSYAAPESSDGSLVVVISNIPSGWSVTDEAFDAAGNSIGTGVFDAAAGTWTISLSSGAVFDGGPTFTPPTDSDIDALNINFTVSETNPAGQSGSAAGEFNIIVDAVADTPSIDAQDDSGDEGVALDVDLSALSGEEVNNGVGADDGSENIVNYAISGVPAGFTLSAGTETFAGSGVYILTPAEIVGLQVTPNDPQFFGSIDLTATVYTTENPVSDSEFDLTNNNNQASDVFTLTWNPLIDPPTISVNNGIDDVIVKEDGTIDVSIVSDLAAGHSASEFLTVTVTGIDASWGNFSAPIGTYDAASGTWTVTLAAGDSLDTIFTFAPNADSDIDLSGLVATAVASDPVAGISASADDGFNIIVDAVADIPDLAAANASGEEGTIIPLSIATSVNDLDGSEVIEVVKISDVPAGVTLTAGVYDPINDVWSLNVSDIVGLGLNVPNGMAGNFVLSVESVAYEQNTNGAEVDLSDNRASAFDTIDVSVSDDSVPVVSDSEVTVDEVDLSPTTSISSTIMVNFGSDAPGVIQGNGASFIGSVTSGGSPVIVTFDAGTNTYTGTAGSDSIFTLVIQSNGSYTFELTGVIDHPDANDPNDSLPLEFGVRAIDSDGSEVDGTITVNVLDDAPIANNDYIRFDGAAGFVDGNVIDNDDLSQDQDNTVTQISFGANIVDVPVDGSDVTIDGTYGTLTINNTGEYSYDLFSGAFLLNNNAYVRDLFEYVLTDGDGDSDSALLRIKAYEPDGSLVVGKNVDDVDGSNIPHLVNGDEGVIEGGNGFDVLVGDEGGTFVNPQTQDYNFVFMLDVSTSMGSVSDPNSSISILKNTVDKLLNEFGSYQDGEVKVHITPFAKYLLPTGTFTVTNANELSASLAYLDALSTSRFTNYEIAFNDAISWLQSSDPLGGDAITTTYFISDSVPDKYLDDNGNVRYNLNGLAMDEVLGSDGSNEVELLKSLNNNVIAVGINASAEVMANLDEIDMGGAALNIDDPSDLSFVFAATPSIEGLNDAGSDVIEGGQGDDILFGDVLSTDDLATLHGLTTDSGAGWEVFAELENGGSTVDASWDRDDTINYIRANAENLAEESVDANNNGRDGGNDTLNGGDGDDIIFGQEGDDVISGGNGNDTLYGGSGSDVFLFEALSDGVDIVKDFDASEGDMLDLSSLLTGYDELNDAIADFVIATEVGGNTIVSIDQSGNAGAGGSVELAVLEGVTGLDLDTSIKTDTI